MNKCVDFNGVCVSYTLLLVDYKHSHPCFSLLDRKLDSGNPSKSTCHATYKFTLLEQLCHRHMPTIRTNWAEGTDLI